MGVGTIWEHSVPIVGVRRGLDRLRNRSICWGRSLEFGAVWLGSTARPRFKPDIENVASDSVRQVFIAQNYEADKEDCSAGNICSQKPNSLVTHGRIL